MSYVAPSTMLASQTVTATHWNRLVDNQQDMNDRLETLEALSPSPPDYSDFPIGAIVAFYRAAAFIPTGWHICNGSTYDGYVTPDLRGMFIYGASVDGDIGDSGGDTTHTHTNSSTGTEGSHDHSASGTTGTAGTTASAGSGATTISVGGHTHNFSMTTSSAGSHSHTVATTGTGSSLPPYVKLYWITRTA